MALTVEYLTGFEHGLASNQGQGLFPGLSGAGSTVVTTTPRSGSYCGRVTVAAAGFGFFTSPTVSGTKAGFCIAIRPDTGGMPSSETSVVDIVPSAGIATRIIVNAAGDIALGEVAGTQVAGPTGVVSTSGWTYVECLYDMAAGTIDWWVNGTQQTQLTGQSTTSSSLTIRCGRNAASGPAFTFLYDDWMIFTWSALADRPGDIEILGIDPGADGTHNAGTTVFITGDTATTPNYTNSTTTAHQQVTKSKPWTTARSTTANVSAEVHVAGAYLEIAPNTAQVPSGRTALGVRALLSYSAPGTQANLGAAEVRNSAGATSTLWGVINGTGADYSESSNFFKGAMVTKPAAGWTESEIEAIRWRIGLPSGAGDVSPRPTWQALMLEAAFTVAGGGTAHDPGTIADALAITDAVDVSIGRALSFNDPLAVADSATPESGKGVAVNDALAITDAVKFDRTIVLADALAVSDAATPAIGYAVAVNDALAIADATTPQTGKGVSVDDALGIADSTATVAVLARTIADALAITDAAAPEVARNLVVADGLGLTDAQAFARTLALADALDITDAATPALSKAIAQADALAIVDAAASSSGVLRAISDALAVTDSAAAAIVILVNVDDALAVTDARAFAVGYVQTVADALAIVDTVSPSGPGVITFIDFEGEWTLTLDEALYSLELAERSYTLEHDAAPERTIDLDETNRELDLDA